MAQGQLGHGVGGGHGGVPDCDAVFLGVLHVDVVHADAAADNELQPAALGLVDVAGPDLGGGAHHHRVGVPQGRAQLLGGVELLHHLVAVGPQLLQSGLVHAVGD